MYKPIIFASHCPVGSRLLVISTSFLKDLKNSQKTFHPKDDGDVRREGKVGYGGMSSSFPSES